MRLAQATHHTPHQNNKRARSPDTMQVMEQNMHKPHPMHSLVLWACSVLVVCAQSCFIPIEVEPKPQPINLPPFILRDRIQPQELHVEVTDTSITLRLDGIYDPNDHESLDVFWYSATLEDRLKTENTARLSASGFPDALKNTHYTFSSVDLTIDVCSRVNANVFHETIIVYISDGDIEIGQGSREPLLPEGAYTVSHTWALNYEINCN